MEKAYYADGEDAYDMRCTFVRNKDETRVSEAMAEFVQGQFDEILEARFSFLARISSLLTNPSTFVCKPSKI